MHCKGRYVSHILFITNQIYGSDVTYDWSYQYQPQKFGKLAMINYDSDRRFSPLTNSDKSLTGAYRLKALKSFS